jgi:hypothetical protein
MYFDKKCVHKCLRLFVKFLTIGLTPKLQMEGSAMTAGFGRPIVQELCCALPSLHVQIANQNALGKTGGFFDARERMV